MENKLRCIIIDDEPLAVDLLVAYSQKFSFLELCLATTDVYEAIHILQQEIIDLIFVDIQMPELSGIQLMKMFNEKHRFIITSAYQDYALASYEYQVIDYLLKPITFERFYQSMEKVKKSILSLAKDSDKDQCLVIKSNGKLIKLNKNDIIYVEGLKDYVQIVLASNIKYIVYSTLKNMEESLCTDFIRVHRSFLVQTAAIKILEGNQIIMGEIRIPIGESYKANVLEAFRLTS